MAVMWLCYPGFNWTEQPTTPEVPRSYGQLKYSFSFIICQLLSCLPPTVSVLLRPLQGSDFPSHPHIKSLQTWKVPYTHFRYNNCSFKATPPVNAQKNKLSKKPAGQSVSHHIRTATPNYAELHTPKQGDGPLTKAALISALISALQCPGDHHGTETNISLYLDTWPARAARKQRALLHTHSPQWRNSSELSNYVTNLLITCNGKSQHTRPL